MLKVQYISQEQWQSMACRFVDFTYRQSWGFGVACASRLGATSDHVGIWDGEELLGLADVRVKQALPGIGIAYVNGGPLACGSLDDDAAHDRRFAGCVMALRDEYVGNRRCLLRIRPAPRANGWMERQAAVLMAQGFCPRACERPYRTMLVDLAPPLDVIRKALDQKWRNALNRAEKNGLTISQGVDGEIFAKFCRLFAEMSRRKAFPVDLAPAFYMRLQEMLPDHERFRVVLAEYEGQAVSGHVSSLLGDTCVYLLGASTEMGLQSKASYLLQWHTIKSAQENGCRWYDLGGIDPAENPGVYHFKKGMSGVEVAVPGPFERSPGGIRSLLVAAGERTYGLLRRFRNTSR